MASYAGAYQGYGQGGGGYDDDAYQSTRGSGNGGGRDGRKSKTTTTTAQPHLTHTYFLPDAEKIHYQVIRVRIQSLLGAGATCRYGHHENSGAYGTFYKASMQFTPAQLEDLREDSKEYLDDPDALNARLNRHWNDKQRNYAGSPSYDQANNSGYPTLDQTNTRNHSSQGNQQQGYNYRYESQSQHRPQSSAQYQQPYMDSAYDAYGQPAGKSSSKQGKYARATDYDGYSADGSVSVGIGPVNRVTPPVSSLPPGFPPSIPIAGNDGGNAGNADYMGASAHGNTGYAQFSGQQGQYSDFGGMQYGGAGGYTSVSTSMDGYGMGGSGMARGGSSGSGMRMDQGTGMSRADAFLQQLGDGSMGLEKCHHCGKKPEKCKCKYVSS